MTRTVTGDDRCWPCTVGNAVVGLVVGWLPLAVELLTDGSGPVLLAVGWGVAVTAFTGYRLVDRGYLPLAEPVAKATGLHGRIGPGAGARSDGDARPDGATDVDVDGSADVDPDADGPTRSGTGTGADADEDR